MEIKHRHTNAVMKVVQADSLRGADLCGAALCGANLQGADLRGANLQGADLRGANLQGADLQNANLQGADLRDANLQDAYLRGVNLYGVNLYGANLQGADLYGTNLQNANLQGANLQGANLRSANLQGAYLQNANLYGVELYGANLCTLDAAQLLIVPEAGDTVGWKKCEDAVIVKLLIPDGVPRHNATGRKCRAERAIVLEVVGAEYGVSTWDSGVRYIVGETVIAPNYEPDRWQECAGGIHFFITRAEAEAY